MIWYDMIRYDMIWYDMIWYDVYIYIYICTYIYLYIYIYCAPIHGMCRWFLLGHPGCTRVYVNIYMYANMYLYNCIFCCPMLIYMIYKCNHIISISVCVKNRQIHPFWTFLGNIPTLFCLPKFTESFSPASTSYSPTPGLMFPKLRLPCHFVAKNFDKRVVGGGHRSKVSGSTTVGGKVGVWQTPGTSGRVLPNGGSTIHVWAKVGGLYI